MVGATARPQLQLDGVSLLVVPLLHAFFVVACAIAYNTLSDLDLTYLSRCLEIAAITWLIECHRPLSHCRKLQCGNECSRASLRSTRTNLPHLAEVETSQRALQILCSRPRIIATVTRNPTGNREACQLRQSKPTPAMTANYQY